MKMTNSCRTNVYSIRLADNKTNTMSNRSEVPRAIRLYEQRERQLELQDECLRRELKLIERFESLANRFESVLAAWEERRDT